MTCNFSLAKSVRALSFFSPRNLLSYVTFTHPMQVQFQLYLQDAEKQYTFSHRFSTTLHNSYKKLFFPSIFKGFSPKTTIFLGFSKNKICKVNSDFFRFCHKNAEGPWYRTPQRGQNWKFIGVFPQSFPATWTAELSVVEVASVSSSTTKSLAVA